MTFSRIFIIGSVALFVGIGVMGLIKKKDREEVVEVQKLASSKASHMPVEKNLERVIRETTREVVAQTVREETAQEVKSQQVKVKQASKPAAAVKDDHIGIDRIRQLFSRGTDKLPIVETISYTPRVTWLKGRPAWIADYASYYQTSRHFIARSLNGKNDYLTQKVGLGDKFNVFRLDKKIEFYLLVDLASCKMDFYYLDLDADERVFIKSYDVGVGRLDALSPSGSLTPVGKYKLGDKVAIYKEGMEHYYQNRKTQMVEVFGTRWIPFGEEIENCSDSSRGYGIHGVPCIYDSEKGALVEQENDGVGGYNSDGCLRLHRDDVEELFAIVITKPTVVEIVKDKSQAALPMARENLLDK